MNSSEDSRDLSLNILRRYGRLPAPEADTANRRESKENAEID